MSVTPEPWTKFQGLLAHQSSVGGVHKKLLKSPSDLDFFPDSTDGRKKAHTKVHSVPDLSIAERARDLSA